MSSTMRSTCTENHYALTTPMVVFGTTNLNRQGSANANS
jgi:hypothetical protein